MSVRISEAVETAIEQATNAHDLALGFDGCPCFSLEFGGMKFDGACWRSGPTHISGCTLTWSSMDHPKDAKKIAEALKLKLDAMDWYGEWTLVQKATPR